MKLIHELSQALKDTYRLEKRYYVLTTLVGVAGLPVGIGILLFCAITLAKAFGLGSNGPVAGHLNGLLWLTAFLVFIPVSLYSGMVIVASLFSIVMVCLGKFTAREAIRYSLFSRYPESWFGKK